MSSLAIYLFTLCESVGLLFLWLGGVTLAYAAVAAAVSGANSEFAQEGAGPYFKRSVKMLQVKTAIIVGIVTLFIGVMVPSKKDIALIYFVPKLIANEQVQQLPSNIVQLANESITYLIKEIKDEVVSK